MEQTTPLIESLEKACEKNGYAPDTITLDLSRFPEKHRGAVQAFANLLVVHEAQQAGRQLDYNDSNQRKWAPWFDLETDENNPTGFRFDVSYYFYAAALSGGSRLCLHSEEESDHMGKTFASEYEKILKV